jgi:hypothetical protein
MPVHRIGLFPLTIRLGTDVSVSADRCPVFAPVMQRIVAPVEQKGNSQYRSIRSWNGSSGLSAAPKAPNCLIFPEL